MSMRGGNGAESRRVLVVASNKREFDYYRSEHRESGDDYIYVSDERRLRGVRDAEVVFYGTFYERKDLRVIEETVRVKRLAGDLR